MQHLVEVCAHDTLSIATPEAANFYIYKISRSFESPFNLLFLLPHNELLLLSEFRSTKVLVSHHSLLPHSGVTNFVTDVFK
jgi:hypothetical protein